MKNKLFTSFPICLAGAILLFTGCGREEKSEEIVTDIQPDSTQIFIIGKDNSAVWKSIKNGIQAAAKTHPQTVLTLLEPQEPHNLSQQLQLVNSIDSGSSGLILDPVDEVALSIPARQLSAGGLKIIALNPGLEPDIEYIGSTTPLDSTGIKPAMLMGALLSQSGSILIVNHPREKEADTIISDSFKNTLESNFPDISILAEETYEATGTGAAFALSETMLIMYPQVEGVFCTHPDGTAGMLKALREIDKSSSVKLIGAGYNDSFDMAIGEGEIDAVFIEDTYSLGMKLLEGLMQSLAEGEIQKKIESTILPIGRDNIHSEGVQNLIQSLSDSEF